MSDLSQALMTAVGKAALAKHQESCEACSDDHECVIAKAHRRTLAGITQGDDR